MPYDVDGGAGGALGFAASFLAGRQAKVKAQQELEQQKTENAYKASMLALTQQESADAHNKNIAEGKVTNDQSFAKKTLAGWAAKHPPPNPASANYQASKQRWNEAYIYKARTLGIGQEAESEISTGSLADLRGSQQEEIVKGKIPYYQANVGLSQSRASEVTKHFSEQMALLNAHGQQQQALQYQRLQAQSAAQSRSIAAQYGLRQMTDQDHMAIGAMTVSLMQQGRNQHDALMAAMQQYQAQEREYTSQEKQNAAATIAEKAQPFPDIQAPQAPEMPAQPSYQDMVNDAYNSGVGNLVGHKPKAKTSGGGHPTVDANSINQQREQLILSSFKGFQGLDKDKQQGIKSYVRAAVAEGKSAQEIIGKLHAILPAPAAAPQPQGNWMQGLYHTITGM
jgi:hypothetical protein